MEYMTEWVLRDIEFCIGCNRCMDACPVSKEPFTIGELNLATSPEGNLPNSIREFALNCVQCGRCVPVCPAGARRDYMVLFIKCRLPGNLPSRAEHYLKIKGPFVSGLGKLQQRVYSSTQKVIHRDLAPYMESEIADDAPKGGLLFYPGCYIYNTKLTRRQMRLLEHVGEPFSVLAGLNTCCGVPQLVLGEFYLADQCLDSLHRRIMKARPKTIVTSCAECLEALLRIRAKHHESFEVLSVLEYLLRNIDRFPEVKLRGKVTLHDSCRMTRKYHRGSAPRAVLDRFCESVEMENSGQDTMCCYYWNLEHDPANTEHRLDRIRSARKIADTMACDCISCFEKYESFSGNGFEVLDILQLFEESIEHSRSMVGEIETGGLSEVGNGDEGTTDGGGGP
jgi:Fe-S oxidoreductase